MNYQLTTQDNNLSSSYIVPTNYRESDSKDTDYSYDEMPLDLGSQTLLGYLPALVIKQIIEDNKDLHRKLPCHYLLNTVSLFADISGFTKLSENFSSLGRVGANILAYSLNRYMERLINKIAKNGGDIFKFAGDALLVIWPENKNLQESCKRALQCALEIQSELHNVEVCEGKSLSVKIGIGVGEVRILFVGGQFNRSEYLIVGEAMRVACLAETKAQGGDTILHSSVYDLIGKSTKSEKITDNDISHEYEDAKNMTFYKVKSIVEERIKVKAEANLIRDKFNPGKVRNKLTLLKSLVPKAISVYLDIEKEYWSRELRLLTIMFLNLTVDLSQTRNQEGIVRIQNIVKTVQRCIYLTKGSLNKFLMDDKGSVMLIVWGLPPTSEINDPARAVITAMELTKQLTPFQCGAKMGITTGSCFTGVCGTIGGRREYSLLGEVVNLSARYMQKAIEHSGKSEKYSIMLCEKTRNLIQRSICCEWVCEGECKGFNGKFQFYKPMSYINNKYINISKEIFLPQVRTHRNNFLIGKVSKFELEQIVPHMGNRSLFLSSRKNELYSFKADINKAIKNLNSEFICIRGVIGSGKSLFIRRALYEEINSVNDLRSKIITPSTINNPDFIFVSFQTPRTLNIPFNGFNKIFRKIVSTIKELKITKANKTGRLGDVIFEYSSDFLGELLYDTDCYSYRKFIEEILDIDFSNHFEVLSYCELYNKLFKTMDLEDIDLFFFKRDFKGNSNSKSILRFFIELLKRYKKFINNLPLILIIEDCHLIDNLSIQFLNLLKELNTIPGVIVICSHRDPLVSVEKQENIFLKNINNLFPDDKIYIMGNILEKEDVKEIILNYLYNNNINCKSINPKIIDIVLKKSFKGNPLFIIEIIDSLFKSSLIVITNNTLNLTDELLEMDRLEDYSMFPIPIVIEKYVGHVLDCYSSIKETLVLKWASAIGSIFTLQTIFCLNDFNNFTYDDIKNILYSFEEKGLLDVLYDLNIENAVFKFTIPFCREILYNRMLVEQRSDLHINIARSLQNLSFSYMPLDKEYETLKHHLKLSQTSVNEYLKKDEDNSVLNNINLKQCVIKKIQQRIKLIEKRIEKSPNNIICVYYGSLDKKSDKNITWEERFLGVSQTKLCYWYNKVLDYDQNKVPLGHIYLKHIHEIEIKPDYSIGNKENILSINVAQWYKKGVIHGPRNYIFCCSDKETLYTWVIALNFLRMKCLYDDFSKNFGIVPLPLFANEKNSKEENKYTKKKFNKYEVNKLKFVNENNIEMTYHSICRKSLGNKDSNHKTSSHKNSRLNNANLKRISYMQPNKDKETEQNDYNEMLSIKNVLQSCMNIGIPNFLGFIQDIIFNYDCVGQHGAYCYLYIPTHLSDIKQLVANYEEDSKINEIIEKWCKETGKTRIYNASNLNSKTFEDIKEDANEYYNKKDSLISDCVSENRLINSISAYNAEYNNENKYSFSPTNKKQSILKLSNNNINKLSNDKSNKTNSFDLNNINNDNIDSKLFTNKGILNQNFNLNRDVELLDEYFQNSK